MCFLNFCEKVLGNWLFSRKYLVRCTLERKQILTRRTEHHFRLQGYTGLHPSSTWVYTLYSRRRICSRKEQAKKIHVRQFCSENDPFQFVHACSHVESSHTSLGHGIKKTLATNSNTKRQRITEISINTPEIYKKAGTVPDLTLTHFFVRWYPHK